MKPWLITLGITLTVLTGLSNQFLPHKEYLALKQLQNLGYKNYPLINNNSLLYQFKISFEKLAYFKKERLFEERFSELVFISNSQKTNFLPEMVDKYISISGELINQKKDLSPDLIKTIPNKISLLEKLRDGFHSNSLPWIKLKQAIETTQRLI